MKPQLYFPDRRTAFHATTTAGILKMSTVSPSRRVTRNEHGGLSLSEFGTLDFVKEIRAPTGSHASFSSARTENSVTPLATSLVPQAGPKDENHPTATFTKSLINATSSMGIKPAASAGVGSPIPKGASSS
jgi:hypothetical protein